MGGMFPLKKENGRHLSKQLQITVCTKGVGEACSVLWEYQHSINISWPRVYRMGNIWLTSDGERRTGIQDENPIISTPCPQ